MCLLTKLFLFTLNETLVVLINPNFQCKLLYYSEPCIVS